MRERGVRVVFSPERPWPRAGALRVVRDRRSHDRSDPATNERTSNIRLGQRSVAGPVISREAALAADLRNRMPDEECLGRTATLFAALADQQRIKLVLALVAVHELCVGEVARALQTSVSVASHHLRKLRLLGILQHRGEGKRVYYSLRERYISRLVVAALAKGNG